MNQRAMIGCIPGAIASCGAATVGARSATIGMGLRSAAICLASLLLVVPLAAAADSNDATDSFFWEAVGGCKTVSGTEKYLRRYPEGLHAEEANACLKRWEDDQQAAWDRVKACTDLGAVKRFLQESPKSRYAAEASECIASLERGQRIERQLTGCRKHFSAGRIVSGRGGNALDCYGEVLDEDPGNPEAHKGIDDIVAHYSGKAAEALNRGDPVTAEQAIEQVAEIVPESPDLADLRRKLQDLNREIADQERLQQERETLRTEAETLFEQGEYEEVIALVANGHKRGVDDKRASALGRQAQDALDAAEEAQNLEAKVNEVRARIEQKDTAGARTSLEEAKDLGLDDETSTTLAAEIDAAEREKDEAARQQALEAMMSESQALRERGDHEGARDALRRALDLGLPEARYQEEMQRIDRLAAAELLATCLDHKSRRRWQEALACVRQVIELDADHTEAREEERELDMLVAFSEVYQSPSVEGFFRFVQDYAWSPFVDAANEGLAELESAYWEEVKAANTPERYLRYLEIYPAGLHSSEARRLAGGG